MSLLSQIPDILGSISFWLNGFDNCSLWMASDSKLRQTLVDYAITDFHINYTIPGRYLWPGNFLKRLKRLSRLSLVVDQEVYHLPIQNVKLFAIPTLKSLKFDFGNSHQIIKRSKLTPFNPPTAPRTSSSNMYINFNTYFPNLEYLEIIKPWMEDDFSIDLLCFLPQKLETLLLPNNYVHLDWNSNHFNSYITRLPRSLKSLNVCFHSSSDDYLDFASLPPNLTSLITDVAFDDQTYRMIPKSLKLLHLEPEMSDGYNLAELSRYLPTGFESLKIVTEDYPVTSEMFTHLKNLEHLSIRSEDPLKLNQFITKCPPRLKSFDADIDLTDLSISGSLFGNCLTSLKLGDVSGINAQFIASLPQSLTELSFHNHSTNKEPFSFLSVLPKNLKLLATGFEIIDNTSMLPESLTFLDVSSPNPSVVPCFDRLPPKLETLSVQTYPISLVLKKLPETLTEMYIDCDVVFDDEIVRMLPRGLKRLSLGSQDTITDSGAADLPPHLRRLLLRQNTTLTDDAVELLPRSLTYFHLSLNANFTDKCIKHLPRKLIGLHLDKATKITSKSCKDLPKYLEVLFLPKCRDWDPAMLIRSKKQLPKFIQSVNFGNEKANEAYLMLQSQLIRESNLPTSSSIHQK